MFLHFQNGKNHELHMELFSVFYHEQGRHKQASNATVTIFRTLKLWTAQVHDQPDGVGAGDGGVTPCKGSQ